MQPNLQRLWTALFLAAAGALFAIFACAPLVAFAGTGSSTLAATPSLDVAAKAIDAHAWPVLIGWAPIAAIWAWQRFRGDKLVSHGVAEGVSHLIAVVLPTASAVVSGADWRTALMGVAALALPSVLAWRASPRTAGDGEGGLPLDPKLTAPTRAPSPPGPGMRREAALQIARQRFHAARAVRAARRAMSLLGLLAACSLAAGCASLNTPVVYPCDPTDASCYAHRSTEGRKLVQVGPNLFANALPPECQAADNGQRTWGGVEVAGLAGAGVGAAVGGFGQVGGSASQKAAFAVAGAIITAIAGGVSGTAHFERDQYLVDWGLNNCPARGASSAKAP